jgi:hypothetical protein
MCRVSTGIVIVCARTTLVVVVSPVTFAATSSPLPS